MAENRQIELFRKTLSVNLQAIEMALPAHMDGKRLCRMALNCVLKNPKLAECDPASFYLAILNCAEMGLEPGTGQIALTPYKGIIQAQPMYRGLEELARRSGKVRSIYAEVVYEGDIFEVRRGTRPELIHKPKLDRTPTTEWTHVYAVATYQDGTVQFDWMTKAEVMALKARNPAVKAGVHSAWDTDETEMAKAKVVKRLCKHLPQSPELAAAIEHDTETETGEPQIPRTIDATILPQQPPQEPEESPPANGKMRDKGTAVVGERLKRKPVTPPTVEPPPAPVSSESPSADKVTLRDVAALEENIKQSALTEDDVLGHFHKDGLSALLPQELAEAFEMIERNTPK